MSYAEDFDDTGHYFAEMNCAAARAEEIENERAERLHALKGKYVITCIGSTSNKIVYLQDQKINNGGWWTQYLSNALGYTNKKAAMKRAAQFKYNQCTIKRIE